MLFLLYFLLRGNVVQTLTITQPDDWHVHFRDEDILQDTVPATAEYFSRALAMPNLKPALTTISAVLAYRERILSAAGKHRAARSGNPASAPAERAESPRDETPVRATRPAQHVHSLNARTTSRGEIATSFPPGATS